MATRNGIVYHRPCLVHPGSAEAARCTSRVLATLPWNTCTRLIILQEGLKVFLLDENGEDMQVWFYGGPYSEGYRTAQDSIARITSFMRSVQNRKREARAALAMANHPRLGKASPLAALSSDELRIVARFV